MKDLLRPGDTFIDIGANIGYFTLLAAICVGPTGRVFAYEPIPEVYKHLQENLALNQLMNCTAEPLALSNEISERKFFRGPQNHVGTSSLRGLSEASQVIQVQTRQLDEVLPEDVPVSLIKIDIEGAECHALEGMATCLTRYRPDLVIEVTPKYLAEMGRSARELQSRTQHLGYRMYAIENQTLTEIETLNECKSTQFNAYFTCRQALPESWAPCKKFAR